MKRCLSERALLQVHNRDGTAVQQEHLRLCAGCAERYDQLVEDLGTLHLALEAPQPAAPDRDAAEREALAVAMGAGGTGRGVASAQRGAKAAERELERRQKSRVTRSQRDALDRALVGLAGFYRDALMVRFGARVPLANPDRTADVRRAAHEWSAESVLRRLEAVLACREALELNVKPRIAIEAMAAGLYLG
jgi:DNA polymerase-3 subunit delta'